MSDRYLTIEELRSVLEHVKSTAMDEAMRHPRDSSCEDANLAVFSACSQGLVALDKTTASTVESASPVPAFSPPTAGDGSSFLTDPGLTAAIADFDREWNNGRTHSESGCISSARNLYEAVVRVRRQSCQTDSLIQAASSPAASSSPPSPSSEPAPSGGSRSSCSGEHPALEAWREADPCVNALLRAGDTLAAAFESVVMERNGIGDAAALFRADHKLRHALAEIGRLQAERDEAREHVERLSSRRFSDRNDHALKSRAESAETALRTERAKVERARALLREIRLYHVHSYQTAADIDAFLSSTSPESPATNDGCDVAAAHDEALYRMALIRCETCGFEATDMGPHERETGHAGKAAT